MHEGICKIDTKIIEFIDHMRQKKKVQEKLSPTVLRRRLRKKRLNYNLQKVSHINNNNKIDVLLIDTLFFLSVYNVAVFFTKLLTFSRFGEQNV